MKSLANEYIGNVRKKNYLRDFVMSSFIMSPEYFYFILPSFILATVRVNVVL